MIKFDATPSELVIIRKIATRARKALPKPRRTLMDWMMDVNAVHSNGCPLRLQELLDADDFNFVHDLSGIANCLDRDDNSPTAGQLKNFFLPRFARPKW